MGFDTGGPRCGDQMVNGAFAADLEPALTTVRINGADIGRQAAQFIIGRAEGRDVAQRIVDIGFCM